MAQEVRNNERKAGSAVGVRSSSSEVKEGENSPVCLVSLPRLKPAKGCVCVSGRVLLVKCSYS